MLVAALILATDQGRRARGRLELDSEQHAPDLMDIEVVTVIRRRLARGQLDAAQAEEGYADLAKAPIERYHYRPLLPRVWELRHNLTPYDAAYVALAEALDAVLVTADGRLARSSGPRCSIELLA